MCKEKCFLLVIIIIWIKKRVSASGFFCVKKKLMNLYKLGVFECVLVRIMLFIFIGKYYFILKFKLNVVDVNEMLIIDCKNFFMSNLVYV